MSRFIHDATELMVDVALLLMVATLATALTAIMAAITKGIAAILLS